MKDKNCSRRIIALVVLIVLLALTILVGELFGTKSLIINSYSNDKRLDEAIDFLKETLISSAPVKISKDCIDIISDHDSSKDYIAYNSNLYRFDIREIHNERCGGDGETSPFIESIIMNIDTKKIISRSTRIDDRTNDDEVTINESDLVGSWVFVPDGSDLSSRNKSPSLAGYRDDGFKMNFIIDPITKDKIFTTYLHGKPYIYGCSWTLFKNDVKIICEGEAEDEFKITSLIKPTKPGTSLPNESGTLIISRDGVFDTYYSEPATWYNYSDQNGNNSDYSTDGNLIFYKTRPLTDADPKSFHYTTQTKIGKNEIGVNASFDGIGRDKKQVYINGYTVWGADPDTFKVATDGQYATDKNHSYTYDEMSDMFIVNDNNPCLGIVNCRE